MGLEYSVKILSSLQDVNGVMVVGKTMLVVMRAYRYGNLYFRSKGIEKVIEVGYISSGKWTPVV
jgi:hypothetical protein